MHPKDAVNRDIKEVKEAFKLFSHVTDDPISAVDSKEASKAKDGKVTALTIKVDGKEISPKKGETIKADAEIIISYYDFSDSKGVPMSSKAAIGQKYEDVRQKFNVAGLKNIDCEEYNAVNDDDAPIIKALQTAWSRIKKPFTKGKKSGTVQAIAVEYNGEIISDFGEGAIYPDDTRIIITYYK